MPNYCNVAGTIFGLDDYSKEWLKERFKWMEEKEDRNLCEIFIPRPDYTHIKPKGYEMSTGGRQFNGVSVDAWWSKKESNQKKDAPDEIQMTETEEKEIRKLSRGHLGWYDFCSEVWGSKWGLAEEHGLTCDDDGEINFSGWSAWCPFIKVFSLFMNEEEEKPDGIPKVRFEIRMDYDERGCDFSGRFTAGWDDDVCWGRDETAEWEEGISYFPNHETLPDAEDYECEKMDELYDDALWDCDENDLPKQGELVLHKLEFNNAEEKTIPIIFMPESGQALITMEDSTDLFELKFHDGIKKWFIPDEAI